MANGTWGGRFPIGNLLASRLIFIAVRWRLLSRRAVNAVKRRVRPRPVQWTNDGQAAAQLDQWLARGYTKLNIGGGRKNLHGFVNIDFAAFPEVERSVTANILDLSFVPDGRIAHVHTNHVLEHLTPAQLEQQLAEYYRILAPGGLLTIRCPNALGAAYGFWFDPVIEQPREEFIALGFPPDEKLADEADKWVYRDFYGLMHWFYGDVGNVENQHLNIITPTTIRSAVERAGFTVLKMAQPEALNIVLIARRPAG
jgi:hypothetical protein